MKMKRRLQEIGLALGVAAAAGVAPAGAWATTIVDLTVASSGSINGVSFEFDQEQPSGTGVLNSFLRIQANGDEQGYNTSGSPLPFDEKSGPFTRDITFGELEATGGEYLFVLDIGEPGNDESLLSLDGLKLFASNTASQTTSDVSSLGTLLFDLDAGMDNYVLLDANRDGKPGNGVSDMLMRVPESFFAGVQDGENVILWSQFGLQGGAMAVDNVIDGSGSSSTFEEWAHVTGLGQEPPDGSPPIPEPGAALLFGAGVLLVRWRTGRGRSR